MSKSWRDIFMRLAALFRRRPVSCRGCFAVLHRHALYCDECGITTEYGNYVGAACLMEGIHFPDPPPSPPLEEAALVSCSVQCGGKCCRGFPMSNSTPQAIGAKYREIIAWRDSGGEMAPWMRDHVMIAEMLIPLHEEDDEWPRYTCRNLDTETGLCRVYADRPPLCRDFPTYDYGGSCQFCGFKEEAIPIEERP